MELGLAARDTQVRHPKEDVLRPRLVTAGRFGDGRRSPPFPQPGSTATATSSRTIADALRPASRRRTATPLHGPGEPRMVDPRGELARDVRDGGHPPAEEEPLVGLRPGHQQ